MSSYNERKQNGDGTYSAYQHLTGSDVIVPVDIQSKLATTIQALNAVSVGASNNSPSAWIDTDGFDKIAVSLKNDASTTNSLDLEWSSDGVTTLQGKDYSVLPSNTTTPKSAVVDTKMRYVRLIAINGDAAAHTMNAIAYLKA